ncbi:MAG: hypothetical protein RI932_684 [Pseudomonadota bacterium]|jgi:hypothetical protein
MDTFWTLENIEEKSRAELGAEFAVVADLFPRVVQAIYVQMHNGDLQQDTVFTAAEYKTRVLAELPTSCTEVLPFFVRMVWNRKWHPQTHTNEVRGLAQDFVRVVELAGGKTSTEELMSECLKSFE